MKRFSWKIHSCCVSHTDVACMVLLYAYKAIPNCFTGATFPSPLENTVEYFRENSLNTVYSLLLGAYMPLSPQEGNGCLRAGSKCFNAHARGCNNARAKGKCIMQPSMAIQSVQNSQIKIWGK